MRKKANSLILIFAAILLIPGLRWAENPGRMAAGVRAGVSDHRSDENFRQYEGFGLYGLPWEWAFASDWKLETCLEGTAGVITSHGDAAFITSLGPSLFVKSRRGMFSLQLGVNPTLISRHEFGAEDLGGAFQFISHVGLNINFGRRFSFGYRLQHMSNAGIYDHNPGVNLHMAGFSYLF